MSLSSSGTAAERARGVASSQASDPTVNERGGRTTLIFCLALAAVVLLAYNGVTRNGFVNYDDEGYILQNAHVRAGLTWETVKWAFTTYDQSNWHPLTWMSHALDVELFGLNPAGHHYVNVMLHAANAVLLFLLLLSATGFRWRSLMVAGLFALHPIHVESVAWAAERKNVLSMLFFLLALYAYGWYVRRPGVGRYLAVTAAFVLALLAKPQVVTFPFLLLLWDFWPLGRIGALGSDDPDGGGSLAHETSFAWMLIEKLPWFALAFASSYVTMKAQSANAVKALSLYSLPLRLETAVIAYVRYLGKAFWPANLVALYPHPTKLFPVWQAAAAATLLLLITVTVIVERKHRYLAVGWLWFLGSLVPMIGLVQVGAQEMADRYAYIPFIGLFVMIVWLGAAIGQRHGRNAPSRALLAGVSLLSLVALAAVTYRQVSYWHDTESFWRRTIALTENNYVAHDVLGYYLTTQERADEGAAEFRSALAIRPEDPEANLSLGPYEEAHGHLEAAIEHYQNVALYSARRELRATAMFNLGHAYRKMGDLARAKQYFEMTLQMAPNEASAMVGLGLIAEANGDATEAVRQFSGAQAVKADDVTSLLLAHALEEGGRSADAKEILARLRGSPNFEEAQKVAALLLAGN